MSAFLVDDRDGRIVAELSSQEDVERVLEAWTSPEAGLPDYLCIVELDSKPGAIVGVDSSVKISPLS
jgi:hypothetical protein